MLVVGSADFSRPEPMMDRRLRLANSSPDVKALFNNSPSTSGSILGVLTGKVLAEDLLCRANGTKVTESDARLQQRCSVGASSSARGGRGAFILTSW